MSSIFNTLSLPEGTLVYKLFSHSIEVKRVEERIELLILNILWISVISIPGG